MSAHDRRAKAAIEGSIEAGGWCHVCGTDATCIEWYDGEYTHQFCEICTGKWASMLRQARRKATVGDAGMA